MDPDDCPSRVVCPIPRPGIQLASGIETRLERRNDQIIGGFDIGSVLEPSYRASKSDSGVECLWVGNVSEDPRHTPYVIGVCSVNNGKILWLQPRFGSLSSYVSERDHWEGLATEEWPDSLVPFPAGP